MKWAAIHPGPPVPADEERLRRAQRRGVRPAMSMSGVPRSTSTTPGCGTAPPIVTREVPGSSTSPWARNASGPVLAIMATWASVSALCTRALLRPIRSAVPLSGRNDGRESRCRPSSPAPTPRLR